MQEGRYKLLQKGLHPDPHSLLGLQQVDENTHVIRVWHPDEKECKLEVCGKTVKPTKIAEGIYEYRISKPVGPSDYHIFHRNGIKAHDPYAFEKIFGDLDVHLLKNGLHYELYDLLGSTPKNHQGVAGVQFAVWAPNAKAVSLVGEFNHWDGSHNPMRKIESVGVWELFVPGLAQGEKYKFEIVTLEGKRVLKSDPVAHHFEVRPGNSSIVFDVGQHQWKDAKWIEQRGHIREGKSPINIYEVHLGSWRRTDGSFMNYRELAEELTTYCRSMYFTHVELIGACEHPLDESWGYQVTGYFAPTSRFGTPEDLQYFVDTLHQNDIGVIVDWVPAHFPKDEFGIRSFDGTHLYEHQDGRQGFHPQWNTHIFNYGRWEVSNFLIASALFWLEKMHVDGLRVDAVSSMLYLDYARKPGQWLPNKMGTNINLESVEFIKHMNSIVHQLFPDVLMIAEESHAFPSVTVDVELDGLGFDLKWNLGWMNDTLSFFSKEFSQRTEYMDLFHMPKEYAFDEKFALVLSHDEVVHEKGSLINKMPGSDWEKRAGLRLLLSYLYCFPGKKLLFMGGEIGQFSEWDCKGEIEWNILQNLAHKQIHDMVSAIGKFYLENEALSFGDFDKEQTQWPIPSDSVNGVVAYIRKGSSQTLLCVHHLMPGFIEKFSIPLPGVFEVEEVFNTDREEWGGSGTINDLIEIESGEVHLHLGPLATHIFALKDTLS